MYTLSPGKIHMAMIYRLMQREVKAGVTGSGWRGCKGKKVWTNYHGMFALWVCMHETVSASSLCDVQNLCSEIFLLHARSIIQS